MFNNITSHQLEKKFNIMLYYKFVFIITPNLKKKKKNDISYRGIKNTVNEKSL